MLKITGLYASMFLLLPLAAQQTNPQARFEAAAEKKDLAEAKAAIKAGANPNWALGTAATYRDLDYVKFLVDAGADVNYASYAGWTPLMGAADEGKLDTVKYLVAKKANINAKTRQGRTAAIRAAFHCQTKVISYLLEQGANINEADQNGVTALMLAAQQNCVDTVKALVDAGADKNLKSGKGKTAMAYSTDSLWGFEAEIKTLNESIKKNPKYEKYNKESIERYRKKISDAKLVAGLLSAGGKKKSAGKMIGKVSGADGKKLTITGKGIGDAEVGSSLKIKTSDGEISATVKEVSKKKIKASAKKSGAEKGDAVYLEK